MYEVLECLYCQPKECTKNCPKIHSKSCLKLKMSGELPPRHGPLFDYDRRAGWRDHVDLEPGVEQVQHGQPYLNRVVAGRELLAVGHDHVALLGADNYGYN